VQQAVGVALVLAHRIELGVVGQLGAEVVQRDDNPIERLLLAAELLGALRVVPDGRVFEGRVDGPQAFGFGIVVKDTSGGLRCGRSAMRVGCRSG
jgi:hypothetical protein